MHSPDVFRLLLRDVIQQHNIVVIRLRRDTDPRAFLATDKSQSRNSRLLVAHFPIESPRHYTPTQKSRKLDIAQ